MALRGKLMVLVALSAGRVNWLTAFVPLLRAEMGMIRSLGGAWSVLTSVLKKVAVSVVLKGPVYLSLMRLPRSKMIFCGAFQKYMYSVMSFSYTQRIPGGPRGSAVLVRHTSVSFIYMSASRSNWRPAETTVKFMTTLLKAQLGGT